MSTELSGMLTFFAIAAIAIALIGVWWINRTPSVRRDAAESLPLFSGQGSAATVGEPRWSGVRPPEVTRVADAPVVSDTGVPGIMVEGDAIRFSIPAEGTMQFLPGRLEVDSGMVAGRDIRFVHDPASNGSEVTFGRTDGALYRHVQLREPTVSRQHAVLHWRRGRWYLRNLSHTNPVAHNGVVLDSVEEACLEDGDRIEMGEVHFTFRSR